LKDGVWIREIAANRKVAGTFLAKEKKLLQGKTGKPYLLLRLTDASGEVEARVWDRVDELGSRFQAGDVLRIAGEAVSYQGVLQVKIQDVSGARPLEDAALVEFVPEFREAHQRSSERMEALLEIVEGMRDEPLRSLVLGVLRDPALAGGWLTSPAAKKLHHARFGGLLEHTLSVCRLVEMICLHYPRLNQDLLLAGAVLHDAGKILELRSPWHPDYTTEGRLLGHVMLGSELLRKRLTDHPQVPQHQILALNHMILSHHGQLEFGSPKRPKTLEALVLYMLDDLDAKFDAFHDHLVNDAGGGEPGWTSYHALFDRYLYRGPMEGDPLAREG
jgi:3'-5' exoribonuclease